jgi:hypothetical protein
MTRYYIDLKEYAETADINEVSDETLIEVIKDFLLEAQNRALTIPVVSQCNEQLMATLTNRVLTIKSEPDGIVRETMIDNLLVDINCG